MDDAQLSYGELLRLTGGQGTSEIYERLQTLLREQAEALADERLTVSALKDKDRLRLQAERDALRAQLAAVREYVLVIDALNRALALALTTADAGAKGDKFLKAAKAIVPIECDGGSPTLAWVERWHDFREALAALEGVG